MRWRTIGLASVLWLAPLSVAAQGDPDPIARSVAVATEGLERFNREEYQAAYDKFYLAEQLAHSPVFQLYLARCKARMGELLAARERYDIVLGENLPDGAPATWGQAKKDAAEERDALTIPQLRIQVEPGDAAITIDGAPLRASDAREVEVDPGEHRVEAILGDRRAHKVVVVAAGDPPKTISLTLPMVLPPPAGEPAGPLWPGILVTSVGAAGLGIGAVLGGLALSLNGELEDACGPDLSCPADRAGDLDRLSAYEVGSTVSLIAGGLLAAGGVVLLIWRPGGDDAALAAQVGLSGITLQTRF